MSYIRKDIVYKALASIVIALVLSSCGFFEDELKQDRQLALYRRQLYTLSDSLVSAPQRLSGYKDIIYKASADVLLITPRKKNKLLSEVYTSISAEYYKSKDLKLAIDNTTLAILLNPASTTAYYNRACMYQEINMDSLAIEDYSRAILYDANYSDAFYNRGVIYESQTDFQLAIEDYSQAIKLNPSYIADVYNNRGNTYQEMEFLEKAIADYNKSLAIDSTNSITYCNRGDVYFRKGEHGKALKDYNKALDLDSTHLIVFRIEKMKNEIEKTSMAKK